MNDTSRPYIETSTMAMDIERTKPTLTFTKKEA